MRFSLGPRAGLGAVAHLALSTTATAHSWIERALKIDPTSRNFIGNDGFPRGYIPRDSAKFNDKEVLIRLPATGQGFYSGDEIINGNFPLVENPAHPMLEAAPGDFVAILHLENGHTTKPDANPVKPYNRGTIFMYGTEQPKAQEKLFDVHNRWNQEGTGGDKRGKLLATRNFDDGQCYEARGEGLALERATTLGVDPKTPLACQSDIQLPDDLTPGTIYTIYWYWDWPNLNPDAINMAATKNGVFPWAGTFMRGEVDPNGFTMAAIATNESYASTLDIRIVDKAPAFDSKAQVAGAASIADEGSVFNMAIADQMDSNFIVAVKPNESIPEMPYESSTGSVSISTVVPTVAPIETAVNPDPVTVTITEKETVAATTVETTIYVTGPPPVQSDVASSVTTSSSSTAKSSSTTCTKKPTKTIVQIETQYTTVYPEGTPIEKSAVYATATIKSEVSTMSTSTRLKAPETTPRYGNQTEQFTPQRQRVKRLDWGFGHY